jgi:hypothetical protein
LVDWKAGVHTPSNRRFALASVKFITAEKVVKPIFGSGYGPQEPAHRFAGEGTINFLSNEDTSGLAPRYFIKHNVNYSMTFHRGIVVNRRFGDNWYFYDGLVLTAGKISIPG